ncbi:MAG: hypothetical protein A3B89_00700 [Candidatus Buchananbacteria bacterium RIFCSPHIGHO2_02_FULL_40_13]|uniref:Uncharacterized protein n=1 Tax=Candidatus Buchananbacteria bacterium RIFCSPLOWO2_01_FULL_39_33 TaxID=1797543 RepID=A0A1G1YGR5_9BACT|nr:MAG: hypothetical protein A2820_00760 [Candidatus Buchananbacteria bacterium RIFCSPHIGHO2_01_FULL_40_35]OGY50394.1 MAG: hypothetical protein A3B89_00700 [Candidatus Buchananbacteria bacterium RIFCSPHIGHO2_02_FULL_40_13]OGY51532.1 MAG: hypothetical protein A3A02_01855 [Candidatus Buchananbacteria bacterium RIFCSPLOWO2_01_FULL_39_33]
MAKSKDTCPICEQRRREGKPVVSFKRKNTTCFVCGRKVKKVLDLHHTAADLCNLKCEQIYWLDILY